MTLYAWKFIIPTTHYIELKSDPSIAFKGCLTVAVAETEEDARKAVERYAVENGQDSRWLEVATVRRLELGTGAVLSWVLL